MTEDDYVKRMPIEAFDPQGRGGKGIIGADVKEGDRVTTVFRANTHDYLLCFTNQGKVYQLKTYEIPEMAGPPAENPQSTSSISTRTRILLPSSTLTPSSPMSS